MRRLREILLLFCLFLFLAGCSGKDESHDPVSSGQPEQEQQTTEAERPSDPFSRPLIVYFSQSGNTEQIAEYIHQETGAELFKITTREPYPDNLDELYQKVQEELDANARPELSELVDEIDSYDTIFLGYPIWGGTCPMAVFSFLEQHDLSEKTVIPFCTHGGSGFGRSLTDLKEALPDTAILEDGYSVSGSRAEEAEEAVAAWLMGLSETLELETGDQQ